MFIYTNGSSDPYSNGYGGAMLSQNQNNLEKFVTVAIQRHKDFEKDFFTKINASSPDLIEKINTTGVLDDDAESTLKNAIEEFKKS